MVTAASARLLPSWLFPFPSSSAPFEPELVPSDIRPVEPRAQGTSEDLVTGLSQCRNVADIKDWARAEGIILRENATVGAAVLARVLANNQTAILPDEISAYVCDPALHSPGTSFILGLVRAIVPRFWDTASWNILCQSICTATELGLISIEDLRRIINEVFGAKSLRLSVEHCDWKSVRKRAQLHMVRGILQSLDRCPVLQVADLGPTLLCKLFSRFATDTYVKWCKEMVWRLLPWAGRSHVPFIARLILYPLEVQRGKGAEEEKLGQSLVDRLTLANPEILQLLLAYTTERLLVYTKETNRMDCRFVWHHWCCTLAILGSSRYKLSLTKDTWDLLQFSKSSLSPEERLLAFVWTAMSLRENSRTSTALSDRLQFLESFEALVTSLPELTVDPFHVIVVGFSSLALPKKDVLLRNLTRLSTYNDSTPALPDIHDAHTAVKQDIAPSIINKRIQHAHFGYSEVLANILQRSKYGVPGLMILSRRMIHKNTVSFGIMCHFLENDITLKTAVRKPQYSAGASEPPQQGGTLPGNNLPMNVAGAPVAASTRPLTAQSNDPTLPSRAQIIDLIHNLAVSFATSPVATPRAAFRRVYWCYLFFRRFRVPIGPTITRALWHAGVARYGQRGTSAAQLKWILERVREVEGDNVAKHLLWNERFRRSRTDRVNAWSKQSKEEEEAVLGMLESEDEVSETESGAEFATNDSSPLASIQFSAANVEAVLTGNETVDREVKKKIIFLQSEPADVPFWIPEEGGQARHENKGNKKLGTSSLRSVRLPVSFLRKTTSDPDSQWWVEESLSTLRKTKA